MTETKHSLLRALTLTDAIALVVGTVIGTGVFLKTAVMTQQLGSPTLVLLAWLAAGLLSLTGALAYAELGAMFPHAGGEYVYLCKAFGDAPAFLSKSRAPVWAIMAQSAWGCALALSGTFDQISTYTIFALWLFFGVTVSAVFVLRRKMPDVERPYNTLAYPLVPTLFILVAAWLVVNTIRTNPVESGIGLALIALGLPVYFYFKRNQACIVAEGDAIIARPTPLYSERSP